MATEYHVKHDISGHDSYFETIQLDIKLRRPISNEDKDAIRDVMDMLEVIAENYLNNKEDQ